MYNEDTEVTDIIITQEEIKESSDAIEELERIIGTYESYDTFNIVRPKFSDKANICLCDGTFKCSVCQDNERNVI